MDHTRTVRHKTTNNLHHIQECVNIHTITFNDLYILESTFISNEFQC